MKRIGLIVLMITLMATSTVVYSAKSKFEYLDLFSRVLDLIENQYYRKVDTEKLIEGALRGMMETLDPHSAYLDKKAMSKMKSDTSGKFGGLGIEVTQKDGHLVVITPIDDTPAFRAGLKAGDKIVEIEHESTIGLALGEAVDKMRGKPGTKLNVGILRKGEDKIRYINLTREIIKIVPVKSEIVKDNFLYIRLTQFQSESASSIVKAIKEAKSEMGKKDLKGIVFDLRSNPGGLLDEAVKVSSLFLKEGIVVSTEGRDPKNKEVRYARKTGFKDITTPLAVLINGSSASASEIVAGALQDHKRALIMGSQSFGKGSVQTIIDLTKFHGVKLTIQQYMTPSGKKIQAKGIIPDVSLADLKTNWKEELLVEGSYIREVDLRNHLNATIETKEERLAREAREKQDRIERRKKAQNRKKGSGNTTREDDDELPKRIAAKDDYQVLQAVNYLASFQFFKDIKQN